MLPPSYSAHVQCHVDGESEPSFLDLRGTTFSVKASRSAAQTPGLRAVDMATWQRSIQSARDPLLPTHAVTTSAWPGDTPWVNKRGACQSAHRNSSETAARREDLDTLGFGFFQPRRFTWRPFGFALHWLGHTLQLGLGRRNDQFSAGW